MIGWLVDALIRTAVTGAVICLPAVILAMMIQALSARFERLAIRALGRKGYMVVFGWLGSSMHELSHVLLCKVFRHKVERIRLFDLDPEDGKQAGCVRHRYNTRSIYQKAGNFFIAVAPIFVGALLVYAAARFLVPEILPWPSLQDMPDTRLDALLGTLIHTLHELVEWENYQNWAYYLFLYILFCIGSGMKLSAADLRGAKTGGGIMIAGLLVVSLIDLTLLSGTPVLSAASRIMMGIYNIMLMVLVMNIILLAPFLLFAWLRKRR